MVDLLCHKGYSNNYTSTLNAKRAFRVFVCTIIKKVHLFGTAANCDRNSIKPFHFKKSIAQVNFCMHKLTIAPLNVYYLSSTINRKGRDGMRMNLGSVIAEKRKEMKITQ